jgi:hypothetical protein
LARYGDQRSKLGPPQRTQRIADVKDDEFAGDEQTRKAMKGNVTAPFGRVGLEE